MKVLRWLDKHFEEAIMFVLLWVIVIAAFLQVIMRYFLNNSLSWPDELNRYLFIWFSYMALSYSVRYNCPTRIDIIETLVPKLKTVFMVVCDIGLAGFCAFMLKPGLNVLIQLKNSSQLSPAMQVPMYVIYLSMYVGLILTLIRYLQKYITFAVQWSRKKRDNPENDAKGDIDA